MSNLGGIPYFVNLYCIFHIPLVSLAIFGRQARVIIYDVFTDHGSPSTTHRIGAVIFYYLLLIVPLGVVGRCQ